MKPSTKLKKLAAEKGFECVERANGHYQIKGPLLVNYYPDSKNRTAYVAGTTQGRKHVTPEQAIEMCFKAPECLGKKDKRSSNSRRKREALWRKGVRCCHWCNEPLTVDTSTLEHKIPLDRGGLDNANNRTLACKDCNQGRGNNMPELGKETYHLEVN